MTLRLVGSWELDPMSLRGDHHQNVSGTGTAGSPPMCIGSLITVVRADIKKARVLPPQGEDANCGSGLGGSGRGKA